MGSGPAIDPILIASPDDETVIREVKSLRTQEVIYTAALAVLEAQAAAGYDAETRGLINVTDGTAYELFRISIAVNTAVSVEVKYTYGGTDGTDTQVESGTIHVNSVNKAGSLTTVVTIVSDNGLAASSGTLAITMASAEVGTNVLQVTGTFDSSLTLTSNFLSWFAKILHAADPTITKVNADK